MPKGDEAALDAFLKDFVRIITGEFPGRIDCILLSGSAARGDFTIGESDIDMHIILKDERDVGAVERSASRLFWEQNRRHNLKLVRSYGRKLADGFSFMAGGAGLAARPFYVMGPSGWRRKLKPAISLTSLLGLEQQLLRGRIRNGKVLFGRNLLADPQIIRAANQRSRFTYDFLVTLLIQPLFVLAPDRVLHRCAKGILFSFDDNYDEIRALAEGDSPRPGAGPEMLFAARAFRLKTDFAGESAKLGIMGKFWFCIRTPPCILGHTLENSRRRKAGQNGR